MELCSCSDSDHARKTDMFIGCIEGCVIIGIENSLVVVNSGISCCCCVICLLVSYLLPVTYSSTYPCFSNIIISINSKFQNIINYIICGLMT